MFLPRVIAALADDVLAPHVLATARVLAAEAGEPLLAVHAVPPAALAVVSVTGSHAAVAPPPVDDRQAWRAAHREARELLEGLGTHPDERVVLDGDPARVLAALAAEHEGALVVCGTRGQGPLAVSLGGSTSREVLRAVDAPVVLVGPQGAPPTGVRCLVWADEGAGAQTRSVRHAGAELAGRLRCELRAVPTSPRELAERREQGLLVVAGRGRGGLRGWLRGDPVAELVRHARSPVVVAPAPQPEADRAD